MRRKGDKKPRACSERFQADALRAQHMILGWLGNQDQFCYVLNFGSVTEVKSDETCYQAWNLTIQPKENFWPYACRKVKIPKLPLSIKKYLLPL